MSPIKVIPGTKTPLRLSPKQLEDMLDNNSDTLPATLTEALLLLLESAFLQFRDSDAATHTLLLKLLKPVVKRLQQRCDVDHRSRI